MSSTTVSIIRSSLNQIDWLTSECKPTLKFLDSVSKTAVIPLPSINLTQKQRMFSLNCLIAASNFILIRSKVYTKMKPLGFALRWPCDPRQSPGQCKWYNMVKVNGSYNLYKYDRYKKKMVEQVKFLPCKTADQPVRKTTTLCLDPYDTHWRIFSVGWIFPFKLTWVLTAFPPTSFGWEYKPRSSLSIYASYSKNAIGVKKASKRKAILLI